MARALHQPCGWSPSPFRGGADMALTHIPDAQPGAVVPSREMRERPRPRPPPAAPLRLERWRDPDPDRYRLLFRRVGGKWLWFSRLTMSDEKLRAEMAEVHAIVDPVGI